MAADASKNKTSGSDLQPDDSKSSFRLYALGTVAEDLPMKSLDEDPDQTLEVFLDEIFSMADGKVSAKGQTNEIKGTDSQGREYQSKAATTSSVPCIWLPFGTNRLTAPCVRKGMRVLIWRTADEQQLYWEPKGGDDYLMSQERVIYTWQANPDLKSNARKVDVNNCWYLEVDTFRNRAVFGTSQQAGEVTRMFIEADLSSGNGFLRVSDDVHENLLMLHFVEHMFRYQNKEGTIFDVTKENIHLQCEDSITAVAKNKIILNSKILDITAQQLIGKISGNTMWKCPMTTFTGSVSFTGEDGNTVELNGNFRHKQGTWTSPSGTNVYAHDHGGIERGNSRTDPFK